LRIGEEFVLDMTGTATEAERKTTRHITSWIMAARLQGWKAE
jgi:hypothetical protein